MNDPRPPDPERDPSLLDLPLRSERRPSAAVPPVERSAAARPPRRQPPRPRSRLSAFLRALLLLLAFGGGAAGVWIWLRPAAPVPVYSPPGLDLGSIRVGSAGEPSAVTITNGGEQEMRIESVQLTGDAAGDFALVEDACSGAPVAPGESCTLQVSFRPRAADVRRAGLVPIGNLAWRSGTLALVGVGTAPRALLDPVELDFGTQPATELSDSQLVRISNGGSAPLAVEAIRLEGPHAADFLLEESCTAKRFGPDERCAFRVAFRPLAAGARSAAVVLASDAPGEPPRAALSGIGTWSGPPFTPVPDRLQAGDQRIGRRGAAGRVALVNRTAEERPAPELIPPDPATGFSVAANACESATVAPGESCAVEMAFAPTTEGAVRAHVEFLSPGESAVRVEIGGRGVAPRLELAPAVLAFGDIRAGFRTAANPVALTNSGSAPLAIRQVSLAAGAAGGEAFVLERDGCSGKSLAPRASCRVEVAFAPTTTGDYAARLEIRSESGTESVQLSGTGTVSALGVRPSRLEFGEVTRGEHAERQLDLTNTGTARLQIRGLRTHGDAGGDFHVSGIGCRLDEGLGPGRSCLLDLLFEPGAEGRREAVLVVEHDGPSSPKQIPLSGHGVAPEPGFSITPAELDFGGVAIASSSGIRTVTVHNPGKGPLVLAGFTLSGAEAADFRIVPGSCEGAPAIAPGSSCSMGIRFTPRAAGTRRADLVVRHNAAGGRARIRLSGHGAG